MARLILLCEHFAEGRLEISDEELPLTIGRSRRAGITIPDTQLSRLHSEFRINENGRFEIMDLQSTNLTIVNDQDVECAELQSGDRILLGDTELLIEVQIQESDMHEKTTRELPVMQPEPSPLLPPEENLSSEPADE